MRIGNTEVQFRKDEYRLAVWGKTEYCDCRIDEGQFSPVRLETKQADGVAEIQVFVPASVARTLAECRLRLGVDCYMGEYPAWDGKFFPTFFCAEKTHYYGAFLSPAGQILGIASAAPVAGTEYLYSLSVYDDGINVGHRIYTVDIVLRRGRKEEDIAFTLRMRMCEDGAALYRFWQRVCGIMPLVPDKFTYTLGEIPRWQGEAAVSLTHESGKMFGKGEPLTEYGIYDAAYTKNGKTATAKIFVRMPLCEYLKKAGEFARRYKQKPATHCESWYGYFSAFLALKHFPDAEKAQQLQSEFDAFLSVMLNAEKTNLVADAVPDRVQNLSSLISVLTDAYEACGREDYLVTANALARRLIQRQTEDGAFRCRGTHYSCVIYPIKSLMELYAVQKDKEEYWALNESLKESVRAAIGDLLARKDNIGTEGEATFEDGMITCSALQLALFALMFGEKKEECVQIAESLMRKHRCLEQFLSNDCRTRGATERFWETMYDVLIRKNAMTSPHGWTAWKIYAAYYLYLLTWKEEYLVDVFDTLGACLQLVDFRNDRLNWAFVADDLLSAPVFERTDDGNGQPIMREIGKTYLPMISDWWTADVSRVSKGYAYIEDGIQSGAYRGASCDNDVHEIFKCMEETVYKKAFVHESREGARCYNCSVCGEVVKLKEVCTEIVYYALENKRIEINGKVYDVSYGGNRIKTEES